MRDISNPTTNFSFTFALPAKSASAATSTTPICQTDKLPSELISWIIFWALSDSFRSYQHSKVSLQQHRNFASVCRTWRDAVLGAPYLWAHINATNMLERRLRRSKEAPLDINILLDRSNDYAVIIRTLSLHRHRWQRLSVTGPINALGSVIRCLEEGAHILECLTLRSLHSRSTLDFTRLDTPRLMSLRVTGHPVQAGSHMLANLQYLRLASILYDVSLLRQLLFQCVGLITLELEWIGVEAGVDENDENLVLDPISLPRLKHMELSENSRRVFVPLLRSLDAPALHSFTFLWESKGAEHTPEIILSGAAFTETIVQVLKKHNISCITVGASLGRLWVDMPGIVVLKAFCALEENCAALAKTIPMFQLDITDTSLEITLSEINPAKWQQVLQMMRLVPLRINVYFLSDIQSLCDFLTQSSSIYPRPEYVQILLRDPPSGEVISKGDVEAVARDLVGCRPKLVVEFQELEIFNESTGKFQGKPEEGWGRMKGTYKESWKLYV